LTPPNAMFQTTVETYQLIAFLDRAIEQPFCTTA
ncbi:MAG: hypothetical protein ACI9WS_001752, partial [Paraglaciecola psychrophila]